MNVVMRNLGDIKPYSGNPRHNDQAVDAVANSIRDFGFKVPLVIDKDGVIITGHTRYKAATRLGLDEVPCVVADDLTDDQAKAFRLVDNRVSEIATWDIDLLSIELDDIDLDLGEYDFNSIVFDDDDLDSFDDESKSQSDSESIITCPKCGFEWVQ